MKKSNNKALNYFVKQMKEGKIIYVNGILYRCFEARRGWLKQKVRAEKLTTNKYYILRTYQKKFKCPLYVMAHRVIWVYFKGDIPENIEINHKNGIKTDNKIENLELMTSSQNKKHAFKMGLFKPAKGIKHYRAKLSDKDVLNIRELLKSGQYNQRQIATLYNVKPNHISRIKNGKRRINR